MPGQIDLPTVSVGYAATSGFGQLVVAHPGDGVDAVQLARHDRRRADPQAGGQQRDVDHRAAAGALVRYSAAAMPPARNAPADESPNAGPGWGTNSSDTMLAACAIR